MIEYRLNNHRKETRDHSWCWEGENHKNVSTKYDVTCVVRRLVFFCSHPLKFLASFSCLFATGNMVYGKCCLTLLFTSDVPICNISRKMARNCGAIIWRPSLTTWTTYGLYEIIRLGNTSEDTVTSNTEDHVLSSTWNLRASSPVISISLYSIQ